jgi:hypothetical protein
MWSETSGSETSRAQLETRPRIFPTVCLSVCLSFCLSLSVRLFNAASFANGALVTHPGQGFDGADASQATTLFGLHANSAQFRLADDFTVGVCGWGITKVRLFAYQTGAGVSPSTISFANIRIWKGAPWAGGQLVFGDAVSTPVAALSNMLSATAFSGIYRVGSPLTNRNRPIMFVDVDFVQPLFLGAGDYFLDWAFSGSLALSGPWTPQLTLLSPLQDVPGNAAQLLGGVWTANTLAFPFIIRAFPANDTC